MSTQLIFIKADASYRVEVHFAIIVIVFAYIFTILTYFNLFYHISIIYICIYHMYNDYGACRF